MYTRESLQKRVEKSVELFGSGFNCSQAVVASFADLYGFSQEQAVRMSASFGGGIGRMRETCGAACGLFLVAGLETGAVDPKDREGKSANYALVQDFAHKFKEINGSICCGELLGLKEKKNISSEASERTPEYYKKRPCAKMVESAAQLWADYLIEKHKEG